MVPQRFATNFAGGNDKNLELKTAHVAKHQRRSSLRLNEQEQQQQQQQQKQSVNRGNGDREQPGGTETRHTPAESKNATHSKHVNKGVPFMWVKS
jgi:hypothetical protein